MRLAIDPKHSPAQAAKWLDAVEATVPDDAPNEHVRLAEHWLGIYQVSDEQAHAQRGVDILKRVSEQDESNVEAPLLLAYHYDRTGEDDKARTWYETTLDRKSDLPFAQNNLAMILLEKNTDLDRAYELADRAAKGSNNNPYVVDTLALVEQKRGNESQAIVLRRKIAKDNPVEPRWKLALALNLAQADQAPEAQKIVDRLLLEQSPDQWSPNVRDLLEQVNEAIDSQTKSTEKPTADASP